MVVIEKFQKKDIPFKVKWINDERNNKYLHYELPLREDKTLEWFKSIKDRTDRIDYTIIYNGEPVGLIGLLNVDKEQLNAEYYICLGEEKVKGKGVSKEATAILINESYKDLGLNNIYLYTEVENIPAQKFFEKNKFIKVKLLKNNLFYNGKYIDRYLYTLDVKSYLEMRVK